MKEEHIPDIVSIQKLCFLMGISRSRYYQILSAGFIAPPIYSLESKRAYFPRELAEKNISVIRNNLGLNGKVCLFYNTSRRTGASSVKPIKSKTSNRKTSSENSHQDLIEGLSCLGLKDVKPAQIEAVIHKIYPDGVQNIEDGEVLKAVYRAIVIQNSTDNPDR